MASTQEVEMLRRQLDELTAQMIEMRQQSSSTAMNAAVTRSHGSGEIDGTVGVETAPRGHDSRKTRAVRTWSKTLTTGTSRSTDTRVHSILPIQSSLAEQHRDNHQQW